jgi:hypothetical protein
MTWQLSAESSAPALKLAPALSSGVQTWVHMPCMTRSIVNARCHPRLLQFATSAGTRLRLQCRLQCRLHQGCNASAADFLTDVADRAGSASTIERIMHGIYTHICTPELKAGSGANCTSGALRSSPRRLVADCSFTLATASLATRHTCRKQMRKDAAQGLPRKQGTHAGMPAPRGLHGAALARAAGHVRRGSG